MDANFFCISVLTYNRREILINFIKILDGFGLDIPIYIFDDSSSNQRLASDEFKELNSEVIVYHNKSNLGYARNLVNALEQCQCEYVLMLADDDDFIPSSVPRIMEMIAGSKKDFYCTPFFDKVGRKIRPSSVNTKINCSNFLDFSRHAPGLIYRREAVASFLGDLKDFISKKNSFACTYPQSVILLFLLGNRRDCVFLDIEIIREGYQMPSAIKDINGRWYGDFESRIQQFHSLIELAEYTLHDRVSFDSARMHIIQYYMIQMLMQITYEERKIILDKVRLTWDKKFRKIVKKWLV